MPIYQYQCDECGHVFEKLKKRSDPEPAECPECAAADPRRTIAQTAFQLKGGGWYVTDYKSPPSGSNPKKGESSSKDSSSGSDDSPTSKKESKSSSDSSDPAPGAAQKVA